MSIYEIISQSTREVDETRSPSSFRRSKIFDRQSEKVLQGISLRARTVNFTGEKSYFFLCLNIGKFVNHRLSVRPIDRLSLSSVLPELPSFLFKITRDFLKEKVV